MGKSVMHSFSNIDRHCYSVRTTMVFLLILFYVPMDTFAKDSSGEFEQLFDELLKKYWRPSISINDVPTTVFDYTKMKEDSLAQESLFKRVQLALKNSDTSALRGDNSAKAFWINAYNFGAIQLIIDNYPVQSIRSIKISLLKHPWSKKSVSIGGRSYSLSEIEKDILLNQYGDLRILFAVSCAAVSCPDRTANAFTAEHLDRQLDELLKTFFANDKKGFSLGRDRKLVTLSWILKKDGDLFTRQYPNMMAFVLPYLTIEDRRWLKNNSYDVEYFEHDWTLNDLAQASDHR